MAAPFAYTLRAVSLIDGPWLKQLRADTMRPHVERVLGRWDDQEQERTFYHTFRPDQLRIIQIDGADVGMIELYRRGSEFFLQRFELTPAWQRLGLGTQILADVLNEATAERKPVRLQVLRGNPAQHLYERLGFVAIGETETHVLMDFATSG